MNLNEEVPLREPLYFFTIFNNILYCRQIKNL
jgi:hypothetical protein